MIRGISRVVLLFEASMPLFIDRKVIVFSVM